MTPNHPTSGVAFITGAGGGIGRAFAFPGAFAFDVVMRGSVAEEAELVTLDLPGRAICYDCMKEVEIEDRLDPCPECGGGKLMPQGGDEMRIKDLEVA